MGEFFLVVFVWTTGGTGGPRPHYPVTHKSNEGLGMGIWNMYHVRELLQVFWMSDCMMWFFLFADIHCVYIIISIVPFYQP